MAEKLEILARREIVPVAALFGVAALLCVFALAAGGSGEGDPHAFDQQILLALRTADPADPLGPAWVEAAIVDVSALGGFAVLTLVVLLAIGCLAVLRKAGDALMLLAASLGGALLSEALKEFFARSRPELVAHIVDTSSMSFPSGHAMLSAATYLTLGALLARTQERRRLRGYILGAAILVTVLIGLSRLYLGVHWPTDVLAGWSLGASWALICWVGATWLARRTAPHSNP